MKKKSKAVIAMLILISMVLAVVVSSFATITTSTNTGTIKVSGIEAGARVVIYQLTNVNYNYTAEQPSDPEYIWEDGVKEWVDTNYPQFSDTENFYNEVKNMSDEAQAFYDDLTSDIHAGAFNVPSSITSSQNAQGTATYPVTEDNLNASVEFTDVKMGTYLVIIENGYMVYTPSVVNVVPVFDKENKTWVLETQNVVIKATNPTITKTVTNSDKTKDNYSTADTISYEIIADIPTYLKNSLSKTYKISDELDSSMSINESSITIYGINGDNETKLNDGYTTTINSGFETTFDYTKIANYDKIKITYTAQLNKNNSLVIGSKGNNNIATLTYSNNPYVAKSVKTQGTGDVAVYTYGIEITKVDKKDTSKTLTGAEFELYQNGQKLYFIKTDDGVYYLANEADTLATTNLVVNSKGVISLNGLDEGTFKVTETKAPDGYNLSTKSYDITLTDADLNGVLDDDTDGITSLVFPNTENFKMPLTGGNGIVMFVIVGILFIITGASIMIVSRKRTKNEEK